LPVVARLLARQREDLAEEYAPVAELADLVADDDEVLDMAIRRFGAASCSSEKEACSLKVREIRITAWSPRRRASSSRRAVSVLAGMVLARERVLRGLQLRRGKDRAGRAEIPSGAVS